MNRTLSKGQRIILGLTAVPMVATGVAGAVATYTNMDKVLHSSATSLGLVAAGEGATLVAALVMLSLTLLGQSTPLAVRSALWLMPMLAAGTGATVATNHRDSLIMAVTPMAMTVSAEGLGLVCRRVVAFSTGAERSNGEFLWQANRARNSRNPITRWRANAAVWRNVRDTTASDGELGAKIDQVRRDAVTAAVQGELSQVLGTPVAPAVAALPVRVPGATLTVAESFANVDRDQLSQLNAATLRKAAAVADPMDEAVALGNSGTSLAELAATGVAPGNADTDEAVAPWQLSSEAQRMAEALDSVPDFGEGPAPLMTTLDVARAKNVKPVTVRTWTKRGMLLSVGRDARGSNLYRPIDVASFREQD